jgi:mono/diheme cytochrome c family protein
VPLRTGAPRATTRRGGLLLLLLALGLAPASAQDAACGRALYADICARCHSDPPGSGAIDPRVRTADQIRAAINRVSPMRFLGDALAGADLASIAAYFVTVLGPPTDVPDFDVSGQWASATQPWWALYVTQHAGNSALSGGWLTFDASRDAVWLYFHEAGGWTGPGIYTASLFRNSGPPFATPPGSGAEAPKATAVGTIALVFTDRDNAEVTFVLEGVRVAHRIARVAPSP